MIIDYERDHARASLYRMLDRVTGEEFRARNVFYADDDAGFYRAYDDPALPALDARGELRWTEYAGDFVLRLKPQYKSEEQGLAEKAKLRAGSGIILAAVPFPVIRDCKFTYGNEATSKVGGDVGAPGSFTRSIDGLWSNVSQAAQALASERAEPTVRSGALLPTWYKSGSDGVVMTADEQALAKLDAQFELVRTGITALLRYFATDEGRAAFAKVMSDLVEIRAHIPRLIGALPDPPPDPASV